MIQKFEYVSGLGSLLAFDSAHASYLCFRESGRDHPLSKTSESNGSSIHDIYGYVNVR